MGGLTVVIAALNAFNTLAPAAGQIIAVFRKPDGTEIPLTELIDGVVSKNNANIKTAEDYLASHPAE
jgi:hypothetical protein